MTYCATIMSSGSPWSPTGTSAEAVYLIGVEFERGERNIVGFEWEQG